MKKTFSGLLVAALAFAGVVGTSTKADAAFMAAICNDLACTGGDDILVTDNGAGDTIGALGAINFSTSAFGYSLLVNTSQSKPIIGSATQPQLDLNYTVTSSSGATAGSSVFLYASDTDFLGAGTHPFTLTLGGTNSDAGTVTGRAWGGSSNTALQFSGANLFGTLGPFATSNYSGAATGTYTSISPYSLTIGVAVAGLANGTATGDLNLKVVPEPASMTLFGLGLMGFGVASRRRKANQAK